MLAQGLRYRACFGNLKRLIVRRRAGLAPCGRPHLRPPLAAFGNILGTGWAVIMASVEVAFKLRYPDGDWVTIYADGTVTGVPGDTVIINRLPCLPRFLPGTAATSEVVLDNLAPNRKRAEDQLSELPLAKNSTGISCREYQDHQA